MRRAPPKLYPGLRRIMRAGRERSRASGGARYRRLHHVSPLVDAARRDWACAAFAHAGQAALSQSGQAVRNIRVDVAPLRANAGDPTATWVEQELPRRLTQALAGRLTPKGGTLTVRIDYLTLGPNTGATIHGGSSPDNIIGVATIGTCNGRSGRRPAMRPRRSTDHDRTVQSLSGVAAREALTFWIARDLGA